MKWCDEIFEGELHYSQILVAKGEQGKNKYDYQKIISVKKKYISESFVTYWLNV